MRWICISVSQHVATFAPRGYLVMSKDTVSLHGCSSKVHLLLLTLDKGYLLTATPPDLERGIAPLGHPAIKEKKAFLSNQWKEIEENNRMGKTRDLFKKIRDTRGTFHAKMGTIKGRNGMDLTEAEDIKKRWQE